MRPVTLITGAAGGLGRALAAMLAPTHDLILTGRGSAALHTLCTATNATPLLLNLGEPANIPDAVRHLGRVTNLVHCAGVVELGTVAEQGPEVWQQTLTVNTVAPAILTSALLERLRAERGTVVFVNSGAGQQAQAGWGSYAASKFALRALADALRAEEAQTGVRVTSVFPGRIATAMQEKVRAQEGGDYHAAAYLEPRTVAQAIAQVLALAPDAALTDLTLRPGPQ